MLSGYVRDSRERERDLSKESRTNINLKLSNSSSSLTNSATITSKKLNVNTFGSHVNIKNNSNMTTSSSKQKILTNKALRVSHSVDNKEKPQPLLQNYQQRLNMQSKESKMIKNNPNYREFERKYLSVNNSSSNHSYQKLINNSLQNNSNYSSNIKSNNNITNYPYSGTPKSKRSSSEANLLAEKDPLTKLSVGNFMMDIKRSNNSSSNMSSNKKLGSSNSSTNVNTMNRKV